MYVDTLWVGMSVLFLTVIVSIHKPISSRFNRVLSLQYTKFLQKICEMYDERSTSYLTFIMSCLLLPKQKCSEFITGHLKHSCGLCCGKVFDF